MTWNNFLWRGLTLLKVICWVNGSQNVRLVVDSNKWIDDMSTLVSRNVFNVVVHGSLARLSPSTEVADYFTRNFLVACHVMHWYCNHTRRKGQTMTTCHETHQKWGIITSVCCVRPFCSRLSNNSCLLLEVPLKVNWEHFFSLMMSHVLSSLTLNCDWSLSLKFPEK